MDADLHAPLKSDAAALLLSGSDDPVTPPEYAAIAARIGMPRGQRAIGVCLATNPLPLFIPCHRVVSTSGGLASHPGGVARKRWLLRHEGAPVAAEPTRSPMPRTAHDPSRLDPRDTVELLRLPRVVHG